MGQKVNIYYYLNIVCAIHRTLRKYQVCSSQSAIVFVTLLLLQSCCFSTNYFEGRSTLVSTICTMLLDPLVGIEWKIPKTCDYSFITSFICHNNQNVDYCTCRKLSLSCVFVALPSQTSTSINWKDLFLISFSL